MLLLVFFRCLVIIGYNLRYLNYKVARKAHKQRQKRGMVQKFFAYGEAER